LTLANVRARCLVQGGLVTLEPLSADMAGGHQNGSLVIDTRPAVTSYRLRTKMDRADANQVLSATTSLKQKIFGLLSAQGDVRIAPKPGEEMAQALSGTFGLQLANGKIAGVNLVNEMAGLAKLLGFRKQGEAVTNILGLSGNWAIANGVADTHDLKMNFDGGSLAAAGTVNLATQAIQMKLTTTMNRAFTDQFSGNQIGGLLTTALTDKNGELIIPSIVTGTFSKPVFAPDTAEMARLRVQSVVPTSAADAVDKIGGAVDAIRKGDAKSVLDIFKRKKQ
jgi:AsmA protein